MKASIEGRNPYWWLWVVTVAFILLALAGWRPGAYAVIIISGLQVLLFLVRERDLLAFPTQIRIVYFAATLIGLWEAARLPFYSLLLLSTVMGAFFSRCSITLLLKRMPWNRDRLARLY